VRRNADVSGQRQAQSAADRGPVHRGDHRLVQPSQREDDVIEKRHRAQRIGRPGQVIDVRNRAGRLVIGSRGEAFAGAGQYHNPNRVVVGDVLQHLFERDHDVERHGVHPLRTIQGDQRDVRTRMLDEDHAHR
jgi:hypothetical protein